MMFQLLNDKVEMKPLESAEYIVNHANDVKIQQPGVETVARLVGNTHTAAAYQEEGENV